MNNFTSPVEYVVMAAGSSSITYTVTVTVAPATAKAITSFSLNGIAGVINETTKAIGVVMPSGTNTTNLIATFSTTGSSVMVEGIPQFSGATLNNFTSSVHYVVTAADGSTVTYPVTVTVAPTTAKAMTSFSLNGVAGVISETTKTIGVLMPSGTVVTNLIATFSTTGANVSIGGATQVSGTTINNFTNPVQYLVTAADGSLATYSVTVTRAPATSKVITSYSLNGVTGVINETNKTIGVVMPSGTPVTNLIATFSTTGSTVTIASTPQASGTTVNNFTSPVLYLVTAADSSTTTYVVTVTVAPTTSKAITSYSLNGVTGVINETAKTIAVLMPSGTAVTNLIASFSTTGSGVAIGGTPQVSGTTLNDFAGPIQYVVTAADSSTATYTVTVTVAPSTSKAIISFSLNGVIGAVDETAKTISLVMPSGTNVTNLIATFSTTGSSVAVGGNVQVSGATMNNFTSPVQYVVTAADSSNAAYTVTVTVAAAGPAPVALGNAGNFVLFAGTGMSSSPASAITGNVGVGPSITSTAITTGFTLTLPPGGSYATAPQVVGNIYAKDYASPTPTYVVSVSNDMLTAYNDAAGRTGSTVLISANLDGLTLAPGLYSYPANLGLSANNTLTLNGGPNDVWIIQVAGSLTTGATSNVVLTGGAVPQNVFWQIQTTLTVGATSTFNGVVLAGTAVTIGTSSIIHGRLLAQTAITMDANTITQPTP